MHGHEYCGAPVDVRDQCSVLFVDNVKAKVFKKYSAGFPCYSLLHSFKSEAEEYKV